MYVTVQASCVATAPGEVNCTCGVGLGGDGISCYGSVAYEVFNQPSLSLLQNLIKVGLTREAGFPLSWKSLENNHDMEMAR